MSDKKTSDDTYSDKEALERFERALEAGLKTPPKPHKDIKGESSKKATGKREKKKPSSV